jgi:hypothetical protein
VLVIEQSLLPKVQLTDQYIDDAELRCIILLSRAGFFDVPFKALASLEEYLKSCK